MRFGALFGWAAVLGLFALPAHAQGRPDARAIQQAQQRAVALLKERNYSAVVPLREQVYDWSRQLYGARSQQAGAAAFDLAKSYLTVSRFDRVEPLMQEAIAIFRAQRIPNDPNLGTLLNELGSYYSRIGQVGKAEQAWNEALAIFRARNTDRGFSTVRYNLGILYHNTALALRRYALLAGSSAQAQRFEQESQAWLKKARDVQQAELQYIRAARLHPRDMARANREMQLGLIEMDYGRFQDADALFASARAFADKTFGPDRNGIALLYHSLSRCALGDYASAADLARRATGLARAGLGEHNPIYAVTLAMQARALAHQGKWDEAVARIDEAQRVERQYALQMFPSLSESEQLSYLFRPDVLRARSLDLALAIGVAARNNASIRNRSAEWLLNAKAISHELLGERSLLARGLGDPRAAPQVRELEQVRARIAALIPQLNSAADGSAAYQQIVSALSAAVDREAELSRQIGRIAGRAERPAWIALDTVRQAISSGSTLVEVARFESPAFGGKGTAAIHGTPRYAAWILPRAGEGEITVVDLGDARALELSIERLRGSIDVEVRALVDEVIKELNAELTAFAQANKLDAKDARFQQKRQELGNALAARVLERRRTKSAEMSAAYRARAADCARLALHPLLPHLGSTKQLIVSPDAHLWLPPWSALPLPGDGPLLIEKMPISYVVSGRDLLPRPATEPKPNAPLLIGDVDFNAGARNPGDLVAHPANALPFTAVELKGVAPHVKTYCGTEPVVLTGAAATEANLKNARHPRVLFLATHGSFGSVDARTFEPGRGNLLFENPLLRCSMSLAGCNLKRGPDSRGDDGDLYGIEIEHLDLRGTDLVVLSACQTALGDIHAGQAAAGLRQAFQLAGARAVVATLWSVSDQATPTLTIDFTRRLAGKAGMAEALREAQLAMLRAPETAHPFYWAAFTLTRNG